MNQFIEELFAFVNKQSRPVQWLISACVMVTMLNQSMSAGESVGKALFQILH